ncbi:MULTISPECIES: transglycosylase SLT domain-containing protein [Rahnella]|uniref:lytic transglycosylase domain-containing protein n=1 Tax=Rahnella TaxID=34037 RepID=UPI003F6E09E0
MDAETIKDFLVSLGFAVDDAGAKKFDAVIAGVTANVFKMAAVVEGAALTVTAFTAKIASGLDNLYWASQRTGASVAGIKALGYAASQTGSNAEAAQSSLESLSRFMRNNPGAEGFLNRLGVQTRDAKGNMKDMASVFSGVGDKLKSMPYYRANQYAQMLGIDENTLMAMRRGITGFTAEYSAMSKAIGFNADQAAAGSNRFMTSLRDFGAMAGMARDKIGANLAGGLAGSVDNLRKQFLDNFPKIEDVITRGVKGLLWLADVIGRVVYRLMQAGSDIMEWWGKLDKGTKELIATFGALMIAWKLLNTAFMMSPIGRITALGLAFIGLYEDYKTWKEGGKSLIDWKAWEPQVKQGVALIDSISKAIKELGRVIDDFQKNHKWAADFIQKGTLPGEDSVKDSGLRFRRWLKDKTGFAINLDDDSGEDDDPVQHAQSVRRPRASESGSKLLNLLEPTLNKLEGLYQLPAGLLKSVAITESAGNPLAQSGAGAKGLFQFMDPTACDMGLSGNDVFDPVKSAQAAAKYLSQLMKMNGGDLEKTLASYNWGVGNVQKYGMGLMPQETRNYVPKVLSNMPGNQTVSQETNIHIHGVSDPTRAGMEVADRQTGVNSRLAQQVSRGPR